MSTRYRERLIEEVRRRPVLYDTRHEQHRDIDVRDKCWLEIADKLGATSESLKREWKILRDSMRQALKRSRLSRPGAPGKRWRYHSRMEFVLPYITRRERRAVLDIKQDESDAGSEGAAPGWQDAAPAWDAPGGDAPGGGAPGGEEAPDQLELFFASVCRCARRLPRRLQNTLKRRTLDALLQAEDEMEQTDTKRADY